MKSIAAGYKAIFVSVDLPVLGTRLNESRNQFAFPPTVRFPNLEFPGGERDVTLDDLDYGKLSLAKLDSKRADCDQTRPSLGIKISLGCVPRQRCRSG